MVLKCYRLGLKVRVITQKFDKYRFFDRKYIKCYMLKITFRGIFDYKIYNMYYYHVFIDISVDFIRGIIYLRFT
jgi:hypothetical protein